MCAAVLPSWHDAQRMQSKASIVIEGLSGTGKSGLALLIARALADGWDKVFAVDSENRSLDLFEGLTLSDGTSCEPFKKVDLLPDAGYAPSNFLALRESAIEAGAQVFVQDSTSHAWVANGGVLEQVSVLEAKNTKLNKFNAWGQPEVMNEKNNLVTMIRDNRVHVISTVRLKEKFEMITGEGVHSIGEQQIMQADMKYEPDLLLRMVKPGTPDGEPPMAKVMKTRYAILRKDQTYAFTPELLAQIKEYLAEGADPAVLLERQRADYVTSITDILKNDTSKQTSFRMLKRSKQIADDVKLSDMSLELLQEFYKQLV